MSDFDSNPFANPEATNPFADPSVRQATQPTAQRTGGMEEFNPFAESNNKTQPTTAPARQTPAAPPPQPAVMQPTEAPPPYAPSAAQAATDDLKQKQEELERKAAELQRKEAEMNRLAQQGGIRENNFPPLPSKCPIKPCFYQDFAVDIPLEFQKIVKIIYYLWMAHACLLLLNVFGTLASFIALSQSHNSNASQAGTSFGLSILYFILFTPCSFICWYRPVYKAFRSDSSFNFFMFFFIFFFQFCVHVLQAVGIPAWGTCGWITSFSTIGVNAGAGAFSMIIAALFTLNAVVDMVFLIRVHRIYRRTGASFEKAQAEFAQGVWSNQTVQQTAGNVAASAGRAAATQAMSGNMSGNRY